MAVQTIGVTGMTCAKCVHHVRNALAALPGVREVIVDLESGRATLDVEEEIDRETFRRALTAAEYGLN